MLGYVSFVRADRQFLAHLVKGNTWISDRDLELTNRMYGVQMDGQSGLRCVKLFIYVVLRLDSAA